MNASTVSILVTSVSVLFPILVGAVVKLYDRLRQSEKDYEALRERVAGMLDVEGRLRAVEGLVSVLNTQSGLFWTVVQDRLIDSLHHTNPQQDLDIHRMDALLDKVRELAAHPERSAELTPSPEELSALLLLLRQRSEDPSVSQEERDSAKMLGPTMRKVEAENAAHTEIDPPRASQEPGVP